MMDFVRAWNFIKGKLDGVQDPILRNTLLVEMRKRALRDWGFDPETGDMPQTTKIQLDEWETDFLNDVADCCAYGVDTRKEKRTVLEREVWCKMTHFVRQGGGLNDIPDDVRSDVIDRLYFDVLANETKLLLDGADDIIKNS